MKMLKKKLSKKRKTYIAAVRALMLISTAVTCTVAAFVVIYVIVKGVPNISWQLLSTAPSYLADTIGILPDILNTLYIVLATLVLILPLGVGAAIYLTE